MIHHLTLEILRRRRSFTKRNCGWSHGWTSRSCRIQAWWWWCPYHYSLWSWMQKVWLQNTDVTSNLKIDFDHEIWFRGSDNNASGWRKVSGDGLEDTSHFKATDYNDHLPLTQQLYPEINMKFYTGNVDPKVPSMRKAWTPSETCLRIECSIYSLSGFDVARITTTFKHCDSSLSILFSALAANSSRYYNTWEDV